MFLNLEHKIKFRIYLSLVVGFLISASSSTAAVLSAFPVGELSESEELDIKLFYNNVQEITFKDNTFVAAWPKTPELAITVTAFFKDNSYTSIYDFGQLPWEKYRHGYTHYSDPRTFRILAHLYERRRKEEERKKKKRKSHNTKNS
jgi:hypothetical protein